MRAGFAAEYPTQRALLHYRGRLRADLLFLQKVAQNPANPDYIWKAQLYANIFWRSSASAGRKPIMIVLIPMETEVENPFTACREGILDKEKEKLIATLSIFPSLECLSKINRKTEDS